MFASLMFVWALKGGVHSTPPCLPVAFKARNQSHTFQWCLAQAIIRSLAPVPFTGAPPARLTSVTAANPFTPEPVTTTLWQEPGELAPSQPKGGGFAPSASKGAPRQPGPVSGHTKSAKPCSTNKSSSCWKPNRTSLQEIASCLNKSKKHT